MAPSDGEALPELVTLALAGEVIEAGRGVPDDSCMAAGEALGRAPSPFEEPDARWFRLYAEDRSWTAVFYAPEGFVGPARQDLVALRYRRAPALDGGLQGDWWARTPDDMLLGWLGQATEADDLEVPGVNLGPGARACTACEAPLHGLRVDGEAAAPGAGVPTAAGLTLVGGEGGCTGAAWAALVP